MKTTQMKAGQRLRLNEAQKLELAVEREGRDVAFLRSALLLFKGNLGAAPPVDVVHPGSPTAAGGAVELAPGGLRYRVDLTRLRGHADRVVLVMWVAEAERQHARALSDAERMAATLYDSENEKVATFAPEPERFGREAAVIHCEIYEKSGWRFRADGSGFLGGVLAMASRLGMSQQEANAIDGRSGPMPPQAGSDQGPTPRADVLPVYLPSRHSGGPDRAVPSGLLASVARVHVVSHDGRQYTGTAFAITPGACMVTCEHVVADAAQVSVVFHDGHKPRPCSVIATDEGLDVALIQPHDANGTEHWLEISNPEGPADLGTEVGLLGYPLGHLGEEINYSQGIINSTRKSRGLRLFQIDAGAAPGSSGGPLFRRTDGAVLGVLGGGLRGEAMGMHVNLAISIDALAALGWVTR